MKNLKYYITLLLLLIFIVNCSRNNSDLKLPNEKVLSGSFNFVLENVINEEFSDYDVCGIFIKELTTMDIKNSLIAENMDTVFNKDDIDYILQQYDKWKGEELITLIDTTRYKKNKDGKNNLHISLSPTLFSIDKKSFLIYVLAAGVNQEPVKVDGYFMLFKIINKSIQFDGYYKNEYTTPTKGFHAHPYSFHPIKDKSNQ